MEEALIIIRCGGEVKVKLWRSLFRSLSSVCELQYFVPSTCLWGTRTNPSFVTCLESLWLRSIHHVMAITLNTAQVKNR